MSGYSDLHDSPTLQRGTPIPQAPRHKAEHRLDGSNPNQMTLQDVEKVIGRVAIPVEMPETAVQQVPVNVQPEAKKDYVTAA